MRYPYFSWRKALLSLTILCFFFTSALADTVRGDPSLTVNGKTIEYKGQEYRLKKRVTTLLFLGIDKWQEEYDDQGFYRQGGQSDFMLVMVINDNTKTITPLQINRDSIAEIKALNVFGQELNMISSQICLAYSYGDGGQESCKLAVEAVEKYLNNISIDHYFSMSLDGISTLNDYLGGIEVKLEDDFSTYDPQMKPGITIRLKGKQAEYYLRYRYDVGDSSNSSRMKRQKQYLDSAKAVLEERCSESSSAILELYDLLLNYAVTDMSRGYVINFVNKGVKYEIASLIQLSGETVIGEDGYIEFYADEDEKMDVVLREWYEPI